MQIQEFINQQTVILIPTLYILGLFLKSSEINNRFIPLILLTIGIGLSIAINQLTITESIIQGILTAGTAVFFNELIKETLKR